MNEADGAQRAELLSELAHELLTPLGVITGYAELLRIRDDEEIRSTAAVHIEEAAERLRGAIEELLHVVEHELPALAERLAGNLR